MLVLLEFRKGKLWRLFSRALRPGKVEGEAWQKLARTFPLPTLR
jgi:hypothetical protein